jgi:hypothetical protein
VVQAHPLVQGPAIALVIPEGPERSLGLQFSQSVGPALRQEASKRLTTLGLNQCVLIERSRWVDILPGRDDIVVAGQHDGHAGFHEFLAVSGEALEPGQFVIELRTGLRVSVGEVDGGDQDPVDRRLDIASLTIIGIPWQAGSCQHRVTIPREDGDAVPGALAKPDSALAEVAQGACREGSLLYFEFLEAKYIGARLFKPRGEIVQTFADVVDVKSGDLQGPGLT